MELSFHLSRPCTEYDKRKEERSGPYIYVTTSIPSVNH